MTELEKKLGELAAALMFNGKAECEATELYSNLMTLISEVSAVAELEGNVTLTAKLNSLLDEIEEIISDELNHQKRLFEAYVDFTTIQPAAT